MLKRIFAGTATYAIVMGLSWATRHPKEAKELYLAAKDFLRSKFARPQEPAAPVKGA